MTFYVRLGIAVCALVSALTCCSVVLAVGDVNHAGCPNEQVREEDGSTQLPDCRAYELVSPLEKTAESL
jgi:hypothetical protein